MINPDSNPGPHLVEHPRSNTDLHWVEWRKLVDYHLFVDESESLEQVYQQFSRTEALFMAVVSHGHTLGLCARHEIGMKLGSQYGYSLFARDAVGKHLLKDSVMIRVDQPWADVLQRVFSRDKDSFSHDIALLDGEGALLGLISVRTLVQLQTRLLMQSIDELSSKQREIMQNNRQLTEDLNMAKEMQLAMLPQHPPTLIAASTGGRRSVSIHPHYLPLDLVSGDFYEILFLSDTHVSVFVADVMGHGVQAALVTSMLRALIQDHRHTAINPGDFLTVLNSSLCHLLQDSQLTLFASAFALVIDLSRGHLHYANAGHPTPILLRPESGRGLHIKCEDRCNGGLLGIMNDARYHTASIPLERRDRILLYSDGLFEVRGNDNEMLGQEGLLKLASRYEHHTAHLLANGILNDLKAYSYNGSFEDDVCLLIVDSEEVTCSGE